MGLFNTEVETHTIKGKKIRVYGCWDSLRDYEAGKEPDFYDVYEDDGNIQHCLNEGDPYFDKPTVSELEDLLKSFEL